ncbi:YhaN family protein [Rhizobium sp. BK251]|uniref:ATP-binding protein n=1 Tax=Rhizobium sp. BK251 TaxID=2512125 RepID=UPI0010443A3F|nr:YhaN family protein [Rhizobium sp. BK251]TCL70383.1 uncharacterized protein YhaN [Rhizobium sp. BK251]
MRFDRLGILRYGALTGRELEMREGAKLHIVYGPNEAGKSSALRAISDLLFGFPTAAEQSFLHEPSSLRVGATIAGRDGAKLAFRRRRGRKNTLLADDESEEALADDALSPFLGGLSREVFERAFGLDSQRLRTGAAAMLQSGGEIGSLLFSAASGMTGLTRLRQSLETEAAGIFAPKRAKDRLFYQALDRYDDARRAERENELKSTDWKKLVADTAGIESDLASLQAEREETKRALEKLRTLRKLEPLLREIDAERTLLMEFADLADVPADFAGRLAQALEAKRAAAGARHAAESEVARTEDDISTAHVDQAIFAAAGAIMECYAEKGSYLKAREDLPRVRGEVEDFDLRLVQLARKLGLGAERSEIERRQPPDAELARLRKLVEEGRELRRNHSELRKRLEEERDYLRHLDSNEAPGRLIDPKPYAEQLEALQPDIGELARLDGLAVRVSRAETELAEAFARLTPRTETLDRLLEVPLPDIATLGEHRRLLDEAEAALREATSKRTALETERSALESDLTALEQGIGIVTRDEIAAARRRRDALWQAFAAAPSIGAPAIDEIRGALREADRLADAALADAERVSRHAQLKLRLGEVERMLANAGQLAEANAGALAERQAKFAELFAAAGIIPLSPDRMIEWRRSIEALAKERDALNALKDELAGLQLAGARLAPALSALADATGLSASSSLPALALARALSRRVAEITEQWTRGRSAEGKRHSALEAIARFEEREVSLKAQAGNWETAFADAVATIGLPEGATVEMAEAALDVWKDVPQTFAERENRDKRVRGMQRDIASFEEAVRALVSEAAPELAKLSPDAAVDVLHQRAIAANADHKRRAELHAALEKAELQRQRRIAEDEAAAGELAVLAEFLPEAGEPALLLERLELRRDLEVRLATGRRRFQDQADGASEDEIRAALSGFDRVQAELDVERLQAEDNAQVARFGTLTAELAECQRRRRELETGKSAEFAVFEKLGAEREAVELARQWVVLKLAAHMLTTSMEAYRETQADPVIRRAGELFSVLTGGRFARLVQDYGVDDELQLLAERATGDRVPLDGLSEGTGDQLYLALRLAFVEDYSARNEPVPLIVDDIFQTFDDERAACGLLALSRTSEMFQTILFTHESSVVEIARRELGDGMDLIML